MGWQDIGDYKCVAENELGTAEKSVKIDVAGIRPFPRWGFMLTDTHEVL